MTRADLAQRWLRLLDRPPLQTLLEPLARLTLPRDTGSTVTLRFDRYWMLGSGEIVLPLDGLDRILQFDLADLRHTYERQFAGVEDCYCHRYRPAERDVVVDVGAGIGVATLVFARAVGASGRVLAIEAHPRTCAQLEATVRGNALRHVRVANIAILDRACRVMLSDREIADHNSVLIDPAIDTGLPVTGDTLDGVLAAHRIDRIDLLKVNIEGAEALAIGGMAAALSRTRHVVIACHDFVADLRGDDRYRSKAAVRAALQQSGFRTFDRPDDRRVFVRDYLYAER